MNLLSRKQISELIQESPQFIRSRILAGHLIEKAKRIDTDSKINKKFLSQYMTKELEKNEPEPTRIKSNGNRKNGFSDLDIELKEHDLEIKKLKIEKEKLDLSKKQARLIELLQAKDIMNRSIIVLSNQYRQNSKLYILGLAAKYKIPDADLAGIQKWFDDTINKSVSESNGLIKKECKIVSDAYAETLNQGESEG